MLALPSTSHFIMAELISGGLFASAQSLVASHYLILLSVLLVSYLCWIKYQPGLASIPGPTLAAYSKLWRLFSVWRGHAHLDAIALHKKHGNLVRIAPNHVSVADPKWIPVFYGAKEDYTKVCLMIPSVRHALTQPDGILPHPKHYLEEAARDESLQHSGSGIPSHRET